MTKRQRSTVVGVFSDYQHAEEAVKELRQAGFSDDQIGVARRHEEGHVVEKSASDDETSTSTGAIAGAVAGAGLGTLAGLGVLAGIIPVIGPAIAAGTLGVILTNAAGGAAVAGLVGALIGAGIPEEEAQYYNQEFEAGRTIVTVKVDGAPDEVMGILRRHGAHDMHTAGTEATGEACATGTTRTAASSMTRSAASATPAASASTTAAGQQRIQVTEEELHAHKHPVEAGEVRVRKVAHTEHKTVEVPVRKEEVIIERHPATGRIPAGTDLKEGEEIRVPVMEEQVTVEKTPVVKEEVTVGKRVVHESERVSGEVRKEEIRVEREGDVEVRGNNQSPRKR